MPVGTGWNQISDPPHRPCRSSCIIPIDDIRAARKGPARQLSASYACRESIAMPEEPKQPSAEEICQWTARVHSPAPEWSADQILGAWCLAGLAALFVVG